MRHLWIILGLALLLAAATPPRAAAQSAPTHTVEQGDTLYSIARRNGLTVDELQRLNGLTGTTIRVGQVLVVGRAEEPADPPPAPEEPAPDPQPEESMPEEPMPEEPMPEEPIPPSEPLTADSTVAASDTDSLDTDTTVNVDVRERPANRPSGGRGRPVGAPDQEAIADSAAQMRIGAEPIYGEHTVEPGETLYAVAARYGLSADTLRALNPDVPTFFDAGATLRLPPSEADGVHRVAEGESLYDVAAQYGVSVRALRQLNELEEDVRAGQYLRIPGPRDEEPPPPAERSVSQEGRLARYPAAFEGRLMANGQPYDPARFVVSHPDLPLGTLVLLAEPESERETFAEVTDRGPLDEAFIMDASAAVMQQLGLSEEDGQPVEVRIIDRAAP